MGHAPMGQFIQLVMRLTEQPVSPKSNSSGLQPHSLGSQMEAKAQPETGC